MSTYSLFLSAGVAAYDSDVDDPDYAMNAARFNHGQRYNVLYRKIGDVALAAGDFRFLNFANYASSEWLYVVLEVSSSSDQVVGGVRLQTTGKDYDGSTDITGLTSTYGTALYPGKLIVSTYNVTMAPLLIGLANATKIRLLAAIACPDNDARYSENV